MKSRPSFELRVLVVDDHPASRLFTVEALRQTACSVKQASGVEEAAARLRSSWPDAVVVDWNLGDGNGADVAAQVERLRTSGAPRPVLVLQTGEPLAVSAQRLFDRVLSKPCRLEDLRDALGLVGSLSVRENGTINGELGRSVRGEFEDRLPRLGRLILDGRLAEAAAITHQLTASAAFAGDASLQRAIGVLHEALGREADAATIAARWCGALAAVEDYLLGS